MLGYLLWRIWFCWTGQLAGDARDSRWRKRKETGKEVASARRPRITSTAWPPNVLDGRRTSLQSRVDDNAFTAAKHFRLKVVMMLLLYGGGCSCVKAEVKKELMMVERR